MADSVVPVSLLVRLKYLLAVMPSNGRHKRHYASDEDEGATSFAASRGDKTDPSLNDVNSPTKLDRSLFRSNNIPEGYGFRPLSGSSTPLHTVMQYSNPDGTQSPLPDPNGLGWPGMSALYSRFIFSHIA